MYKENSELISEFMLDANVDESTIKAVSDGVELSIHSFNKTTGLLKLDPAPEEGRSVTVAYTTVVVGSPVLSYGAVDSAANLGDLKATDKITGDAVAVQIVEGRFKFAASDFSSGRAVEVTYRRLEVDPSSVQLAFEPYQGKVSITLVDMDGNEAADRCDSSATLLEGMTLSFSCEFLMGDKLSISYQFVTGKMKSFVLREGVSLEGLEVKVWVNEMLETSYKVVGDAVVFENDLPPLSKVKVEAMFLKE